MASWAVVAQLTSGTLTLNATDRIWMCGSAFGTPIDVGVAQTTVHISTDADVERCSTNHVNSLIYSTDAQHYKLNGGTETAFASGAPLTSECSLKFTFSDASAVKTSNTKFFCYNGSDENTAWADVTFYAFEKTASNTPAWDEANSLSNALPLADHTGAATDHDFYVGLCTVPTDNGEKSGKVMLKLTYV